MRSHLIVFDPKQVDKDRFRDTLDRLAAIKNWTLFFGNSMCVVSEETPQELSRQLRDAMPGVRFLICAIEPTQKAGWLPKQLWEFMNEPVPFDESSHA